MANREIAFARVFVVPRFRYWLLNNAKKGDFEALPALLLRPTRRPASTRASPEMRHYRLGLAAHLSFWDAASVLIFETQFLLGCQDRPCRLLTRMVNRGTAALFTASIRFPATHATGLP